MREREFTRFHLDPWTTLDGAAKGGDFVPIENLDDRDNPILEHVEIRETPAGRAIVFKKGGLLEGSFACHQTPHIVPYLTSADAPFEMRGCALNSEFKERMLRKDDMIFYTLDCYARPGDTLYFRAEEHTLKGEPIDHASFAIRFTPGGPPFAWDHRETKGSREEQEAHLSIQKKKREEEEAERVQAEKEEAERKALEEQAALKELNAKYDEKEAAFKKLFHPLELRLNHSGIVQGGIGNDGEHIPSYVCDHWRWSIHTPSGVKIGESEFRVADRHTCIDEVERFLNLVNDHRSDRSRRIVRFEKYGDLDEFIMPGSGKYFPAIEAFRWNCYDPSRTEGFNSGELTTKQKVHSRIAFGYGDAWDRSQLTAAGSRGVFLRITSAISKGETEDVAPVSHPPIIVPDSMDMRILALKTFASYMIGGFYNWRDSMTYPERYTFPGFRHLLKRKSNKLNIFYPFVGGDGGWSRAFGQVFEELREIGFDVEEFDNSAPPSDIDITITEGEQGPFMRAPMIPSDQRPLVPTMKTIFQEPTAREIFVPVDKEGYKSYDMKLSVALHEMGHALGLGHPGPYDNEIGIYASGQSNEYDDRKYTVMSYFGDNTAKKFGDLDRAALALLYNR